MASLQFLWSQRPGYRNVARPTIEQLRGSTTLRIAYGADSPPFSYVSPGSAATAAPRGYSADLCRALADKLKVQLDIPDLKIAYVPGTSADRFDIHRQFAQPAAGGTLSNLGLA